ncbi:MAG: hypothetical protein EPO65_07730 [Dehalococcoidia bacterium]|nr:MAG: hypothetical protein EPO65_07730 [Dehalococcoidia bacterium]
MAFTFETLAKGDVIPFSMTVTREEIEGYLSATGEDASRWTDAVPPLLLAAFMVAGLLARVPIPLEVMHTGEEIEARRAVRPGEPLDVRITVAALSQRRGASIAQFEAEALSDGESVFVSRISVLAPPPTGAGEGGDA